MRKNRVADLEQDVYGYLPQKFVILYSELVRLGLASPNSSLADPGRRKGADRPGPLRNEQALHHKARIDRALRIMVREIESGMKEEPKACASCTKFMQPMWKFCPSCGAGIDPTRNVVTARVEPQQVWQPPRRW